MNMYIYIYTVRLFACVVQLKLARLLNEQCLQKDPKEAELSDIWRWVKTWSPSPCSELGQPRYPGLDP